MSEKSKPTTDEGDEMNLKTATKHCIQCDTEISARANLCHTCGSFQNWRRYLNFSNTFLALVVALIAVGTPFISTFSSAVSSDRSGIDLSLPVAADEQFFLLASNTGNKSAALLPGTEIRLEFEPNYALVPDQTLGFDTSIIVDPDNSLSFGLAMVEAEANLVAPGSKQIEFVTSTNMPLDVARFFATEGRSDLSPNRVRAGSNYVSEERSPLVMLTANLAFEYVDHANTRVSKEAPLDRETVRGLVEARMLHCEANYEQDKSCRLEPELLSTLRSEARSLQEQVLEARGR